MDPEITKRLLALPSLREQAEREYASRVQVQAQDLAMQRAARLRGTEVEARLLASMGWYGQAWALREIGRLLGWDCGDDVPQIGCMVTPNGNLWWITKVGQHYNFSDLRDLPGDRPAAIAAILLHLSESQ